MRFESIRARAVGPFRDEVHVDLASIPGLLVAVTGENGAGKSTFLELLAGALDRECPTRGPLAGLATARDAFVEVRAVNGKPWTIRQTVDAISGKGEALVLDAAGAPALPDTKVRSYDAWRAAHLPPPEVLFSSTFAVQGSAGFLEMKPAERKAVLLRVLGIERLERYAEAARERARQARSALELAAARRAELGAVDVDALEHELAGSREAAAEWDRAVANARAELDRARAEAARIALLADAARAAIETRVDLQAKRSAIVHRLTDLEARAKNNRALLERADELRSAARRLEELRAALSEAEGEARATAERVRSAAAQREPFVRELRSLSERAREQAQRAQRAHDVLRGRDAVREADARLTELEATAAAARAAVDAAEGALSVTRSRRLASVERRVDDLRDALGEIATWREDCHEHDADMGYEPRDADDEMVEAIEKYASDKLRADDALVAEAREAPAAIAAAEAALREARDTSARAEDALRVARDRAARLSAIEAAERDVAEAEAAREALEAQARGVDAQLAEAERAAELARWDADAATMRVAERRSQVSQLERVPEQVSRLDAAEGRLAELEPQVTRARAELAALDADLAAVPEPAPLPPMPDLATGEAMIASIERRARDGHAAVARAEQQFEQARVRAERAAALDAEHAAHAAELADWTRLAADLGRDGLQAMEIDAAGPELSAMINDLLHACVSSRWTVTIDTTRASADGKRILEGLEVRVLDTERGREAPVETFSGGERVLIGEAVSLALAMLAARRSGMEGPTLVRDESGAALDPARSRAYVAMLRRAADVVGASKVLLVTHSSDVADLCDARLVVGGGRVCVA